MTLIKSFSPRKKSAFSLIELSVVILVIGIFAAGIFTANGLISKSQISTARSLTSSSPVNGITDLSMWLETSLEKSFIDSESKEGESVSSWKDINNTSITKIDASQSGANKPIFAKEINNIYSLKFNGASSVMNFNASALNGSDYTIFIVEKRSSSKSDNYFIGDSSITTTNQNLVLGYSLNGQVIHAQGTNSYTATINSLSVPETRVFTFYHSSTLGKKMYINGVLANESSDTTPLSNISNLSLGKNYAGNLGEIIIFTKALKNSDRQEVESYLAKKWNIAVDKTSSSCIGGTVSGSGCASNCNTSTLGVTVTSIPQGTTNLTCDTASGFLAGSFSATCTGTSLNVGGSCSCDTANGYALSGSTCVKTCGLATPQYAIFTTSGSYTIPSTGYYCNLKVWAIGAGGGGGGGASSTCSAFFGGSGGAGGVAYKTWSAAAGESVSFSIGSVGSRGNGGAGGNGGITTATFNTETITANGGTGGGASGGSYPGGTFSGGDGGSNGGSGRPYHSYGSGSGGAGGGAIGGIAGGASPSGATGGPAGAGGASAADVSGLFAAITNAGGYSLTSGGTGGASGYGAGGSASGSNATGFGAGGGGGGGGAGGRGGNGFIGGGGGGGVCWGGNTDTRGGAGGSGAVVIYAY